MSQYFNKDESVFYTTGQNLNGIMEKISNRFIASNPKADFVLRPFSKDGFLSDNSGKCILNFNEKFPNAEDGEIAYACAKVWTDKEKVVDFTLICFAPTEVYCNGELIYKSDIVDEIRVNNKRNIHMRLLTEKSTIFIKCTKTSAGFGCMLGTTLPQWIPVNFSSPFSNRDGQSGFVFSNPVKNDIFDGAPIKDHTILEDDTGLDWYPKVKWELEKENMNPFKRIFHTATDGYAFAWTNLEVSRSSNITFKGVCFSETIIWINSEIAFTKDDGGAFEFHLELKNETYDILIRSKVKKDENWGAELKAYDHNSEIQLTSPHLVRGTFTPYIYIGVFDKEDGIDNIDEIKTTYKLFSAKKEDTYWRADMPNTFLRPFLENELYAKWSYPLGVTLYGVLQTARMLKRDDILSYVVSHINSCTKIHEYALWDTKQYGYPGVNHQIIWLDALDDCGSFGSLILEAAKDNKIENAKFVSDIIIKYIDERQERKEDGIFYRQQDGGKAENTLWADDLYMSVPFLVRYYKLTENEKYLNEAAKQFLLFKKYLYMPEFSIMSHVYDFKRNVKTNIPWGRGNGWVLFALSELLAETKKENEYYERLLEMFKELSLGYLKLQGENGLWHQVLTNPSSFEETSCTSMFAYAFARGVRFGWYSDDMKDKYISAVLKAVNGLSKISIDKYGNIYGVCKGSDYSFTSDYYMNTLFTIVNDAHGVGIVLLALMEALKMKEVI